jgi:hypothetical protein
MVYVESFDGVCDRVNPHYNQARTGLPRHRENLNIISALQERLKFRKFLL